MTDPAAPQPRAAGGRPRVVVGADGSAHAILALQAAARAAALLDADLLAVSAWRELPRYGRFPSLMLDFQEEAELVLATAVATAFGGHPPPFLETLVVRGAPAKVLLRESRGADLLVVGSRGRGGFAGLLLGSTSLSCVVHARCPVLVLRPGSVLPQTEVVDAPGVRRVVVGVDDRSEHSTAALSAAVRAARTLEARLDAVTAWEFSVDPTGDFLVTQAALETVARERQDEVLDERFGDDRPDWLHAEIRGGPPAAVLVEASADADLLVLGSGVRNEAAGLLLGAVGLTATAHARCPVLVVRSEPHAADGGGRP